MPEIKWSIDLGGLIMAAIALVFIPVTKSLLRTLWEVRTAVENLTTAVFGTEQDRSIGIVAHLAELKKESTRHRNWLIEIQSGLGLHRKDRS